MKRRVTVDRSADYPSAILTTVQVGRTRAKTPEGYLLCSEVPLARTGWMIYGPGEVPVSAGLDGLAHVHRSEEDLFAPDTMSSFNGKPVINEHPHSKVVDPETWKSLACGTAFNMRRGEGENSDCLVGDLLITDATLIRMVEDGKVEISLGYEADYDELEPGKGRQYGILGNHVALVEKGRCGPRCSIGDHEMKEPAMATRVKIVDHGRKPRVSVVDAVRKAAADAAEETLQAFGLDPSAGGDPPGGSSGGGDDDEPGGGDTHIHIHAGGAPSTPAAPGMTSDEPDPAAMGGDPAAGGGDMETRVAALEAGQQQILQVLAEIKEGMGGVEHTPTGDDVDGTPSGTGEDPPNPEEEEEPKKPVPTGDSAALAESYQTMLAKAEILVPGFRVVTFDAKLPRTATVDRMCAARRKCLDMLNATNDGAALLMDVHGTAPDVAAMSCAQAAALFNSASAAKAAVNRRAAVGDGKTVDTNKTPEPYKPGVTPVRSLADLNKLHDSVYAPQQGR